MVSCPRQRPEDARSASCTRAVNKPNAEAMTPTPRTTRGSVTSAQAWLPEAPAFNLKAATPSVTQATFARVAAANMSTARRAPVPTCTPTRFATMDGLRGSAGSTPKAPERADRGGHVIRGATKAENDRGRDASEREPRQEHRRCSLQYDGRLIGGDRSAAAAEQIDEPEKPGDGRRAQGFSRQCRDACRAQGKNRSLVEAGLRGADRGQSGAQSNGSGEVSHGGREHGPEQRRERRPQSDRERRGRPGRPAQKQRAVHAEHQRYRRGRTHCSELALFEQERLGCPGRRIDETSRFGPAAIAAERPPREQCCESKAHEVQTQNDCQFSQHDHPPGSRASREHRENPER